MIESFSQIPTLSLTVDPNEFFGDEGIYTTNFRLSGHAAERPVSIEYFAANGDEATFQIDAGIRMSGNLALNFSKKPMRLFFRDQYGNGRLQFPLFEGSPVTSFNQLALRSGGVECVFGFHRRNNHAAGTSSVHCESGNGTTDLTGRTHARVY